MSSLIHFRHRPRRASLVAACAVIAISGCSAREALPPKQRALESHTSVADGNWKRGCPERYDPDTDYFPDKATFHYSTQLRVEYHKSYKIVDFHPSLNARDPIRYVLYQCGTPKPQATKAAQFIEVPVQRAVLNDPTFGESLAELGVLDNLYAVNDTEAFTVPALNDAIEDGRVRALGTRYGSTIELAVAADPDIVFLFYSAAPNANVHPALVAMGVHGIPMGDHFEKSQLARSEWLKFFSLFFNREAEADAILAPRQQRYQSLVKLTSNATIRPKVMLGFPLNTETWNAVGAQNVFAQLVRDAGGTYFISNREANSNVRIPFEVALDASNDASVWIGLYGVNRVADLKALMKPNPQLTAMGPLRNGHVYAMDLRMTHKRVFPFLDQSIDHPDEILADFIHAIHPELLPSYQPAFIRELK